MIRSVALMFLGISISMVSGGWRQVTAQGVVENQGGTSLRPTKSDRGQEVLDAAARARRNAQDSLDAAKGRRIHSEKVEMKRETTSQIRNQIETIKEINSVVNQKAAERSLKIDNLKNELEGLLAQIRSLKHDRSQKSAVPLTPRMTQVSNQKSEAETTAFEPGSSSAAKMKDPMVDSAADVQNQKNKFGSLVGDPVDKLLLADTLIESRNYRIALPILLELKKDKSMSASDLNWIRYQLARCYRRLKAFPEAEKHLRDAANSKEQEIARTTSIWWLEQMDKQKKMFESLDAMDQQLKDLGVTDGDKK